MRYVSVKLAETLINTLHGVTITTAWVLAGAVVLALDSMHKPHPNSRVITPPVRR